jgi:hypothetical protein
MTRSGRTYNRTTTNNQCCNSIITNQNWGLGGTGVT